MSRDAGHTLKKFTFRTWWGNPSRALDVAMPHSGCSTAWSCLENNSDVRWKCFRCVWSSQTHFSTDRHISILFPVVSPTFLCFTKDWKYFCSFFTIGNILWGYTLLVYNCGTTARCLISILYLYFLNSKYKPKETCSFPFASFTDFKEEVTQTDNLNVCK